jgi:hypothetical protein
VPQGLKSALQRTIFLDQRQCGVRDIVNTLVRCSSNRTSVVVFIPRNWLNIHTKEKCAFINLVDFIEDFLTR